MNKKYCGYKNYQTWNMALWINNDEGIYEMAKECKNYKELVEYLRECNITETPDEVAWNDSGIDEKRLNELIEEINY